MGSQRLEFYWVSPSLSRFVEASEKKGVVKKVERNDSFDVELIERCCVFGRQRPIEPTPSESRNKAQLLL
jgi:hypothetical protein